MCQKQSETDNSDKIPHNNYLRKRPPTTRRMGKPNDKHILADTIENTTRILKKIENNSRTK